MADKKDVSDEELRIRAVMSRLLEQHTVCGKLTLIPTMAPEPTPAPAIHKGMTRKSSAAPKGSKQELPLVLDACQAELKVKGIKPGSELKTIISGIDRQIKSDLETIFGAGKSASSNADERETKEKELRIQYYRAADYVITHASEFKHGLICKDGDKPAKSLTQATSCSKPPSR